MRKFKAVYEEHRDFSLSDVILGGQDGLVNVLGVILGVAAATGDGRIVIAAGMAATFAESISMGAVAYTSTVTDSEHYERELEREKWEIENMTDDEIEEVRQIYKKRGFEGKLLEDVVKQITSDKEVWLEVMMGEELKLEPVAKNQAIKSAVIVGISAFIGSLVPISPFFFVNIKTGIYVSLVLSAITLFMVGVYKAKVTVGKWYRSGIELTVIGIVSALFGYIVGLAFKAPVVP